MGNCLGCRIRFFERSLKSDCHVIPGFQAWCIECAKPSLTGCCKKSRTTASGKLHHDTKLKWNVCNGPGVTTFTRAESVSSPQLQRLRPVTGIVDIQSACSFFGRHFCPEYRVSQRSTLWWKGANKKIPAAAFTKSAAFLALDSLQGRVCPPRGRCQTV